MRCDPTVATRRGREVRSGLIGAAKTFQHPLKVLAQLDARTRTKTKYRDLSTAQRTIRPSVAPVEMTFGWFGRGEVCFGLGGREATQGLFQRLLHSSRR